MPNICIHYTCTDDSFLVIYLKQLEHKKAKRLIYTSGRGYFNNLNRNIKKKTNFAKM